MNQWSQKWFLIKTLLFRSVAWVLAFCLLSSCGEKVDNGLEIQLYPKTSLVLEMSAYSCAQVLEGIRADDGTFVTPEIMGPLVVFNKMTMKWSKSTKLYIHSAIMKLRGSGLANGNSECDLTSQLTALFESTDAGNSAIFTNGAFSGSGTITSNLKCRIACSIQLANPETPEIGASGELTIKASEVSDEGKETEQYFRVKSKVSISVKP